MDTFSDTQSTAGPSHVGSNKSRTQSLDSGIYVHVEINLDNSLPNTELEEANDNNQNNQSHSDSPNISLQPKVQNNNGELADKDLEEEQFENYSVRSGPDPVIGTAEGLKVSTCAVIPEPDNPEFLMPLSMVVIPPPLPPKRYQTSSAFENTSGQGPDFKDSNEERKPTNSWTSQTSPLLGGVKGNNQSSELATGKVPDLHNSWTFGTVPKVESKCSPQLSPKLPKPPIKPPRLNNPKRDETKEGKQMWEQEAEQGKHEEEMGDKGNKQEQDLAERNERMEENEKKSGEGSHVHVGKPLPQILVTFTEEEEGGEDGQNRGKKDEDPSSTALTTLNKTENSTLLPPDETPDMAATNGNYTATISAKPEPMIPLQPPLKPHRRFHPVPPIKRPQLCSAMRAGIEEIKERRKQDEEQWRDEDLLDKERVEYDEEGNNRDTELTTQTLTEMSSQQGETVMESMSKPSVNVVVELPSGGQRLSLMSCCRKSPNPVNIPENQTHCHQSQLPGTQSQTGADGQYNPEPPSLKVHPCVEAIGVDSNMETLKSTESNKDIQMSGLSSDCPQGTEVFKTNLDPSQLEDAQGVGETLVDGELRQTNQKPSPGRRLKIFAKKIVCKIIEGREEKRRIKAGEVEVDDTEVTQVRFI